MQVNCEGGAKLSFTSVEKLVITHLLVVWHYNNHTALVSFVPSGVVIINAIQLEGRL